MNNLPPLLTPSFDHQATTHPFWAFKVSSQTPTKTHESATQILRIDAPILRNNAMGWNYFWSSICIFDYVE